MFSSNPTIKFEINEPKSNLAILIASLKGNDAVYSDNDGYCMLYNVVNITAEPTYYVPGDYRTIVTVDFLNRGNFTYNENKGNSATAISSINLQTIPTTANIQTYQLSDEEKHRLLYGNWSMDHCSYEAFKTPNFGAVAYESNIIDKLNNKEEMRKLAEKAIKDLDKKENKNMRKINNNELTQIIINEKDKVVTAITEPKIVIKKEKKVTIAKCHKDDEFDPYIGAALAIAYQLFGSKTQFHKYVDNEAKNVDKIRAKKEASKVKKDTSKKIDPEKKKKIELEKLKFFEDLIIKEINERFEPKTEATKEKKTK